MISKTQPRTTGPSTFSRRIVIQRLMILNEEGRTKERRNDEARGRVGDEEKRRKGECEKMRKWEGEEERVEESDE